MGDYQTERDILQTLKNKYNLNKNDEQTGSSTSVKGTDSKKKPVKILDDLKTKRTKTNDNTDINIFGGARNNLQCDTVTVVIDPQIITHYSAQITTDLECAQIKYKIHPQIIPSTISWIYDEATNDNSSKREQEITQIILMTNYEEMVKLVQKRALTHHVQSIKEILKTKNIYLGIYGFENYFKYWRNYKKQQVNGELTKTVGNNYATFQKINRNELEYALTEIQIECECCYRFLDSTQDVSSLIMQYTKAIVQLPQKLENRAKYKEVEWYIPKDNKDCVHVDKNGNGLQRLWQQQLTMFESVRIETAEAIIAKYPTPASLLSAYDKLTTAEGRKLLQDIPIRRAVGPLTSVRKVGPELSSKVYNFFTATNGNTIL